MLGVAEDAVEGGYVEHQGGHLLREVVGQPEVLGDGHHVGRDALVVQAADGSP